VMLGGRIVRRDDVASLDHGAFPATYRSMVLDAANGARVDAVSIPA